MSIKVMSAVWEHSKMKGSALLLQLAIADFADDAGIAFPGTETLAKKIRMSERQVKRLRQILYENDELAYISGGKFKGDKLSVRVTPGAVRVTNRVNKGDKSGTVRVTPMSPESPIEPSKNHHNHEPDSSSGENDSITLATVNTAYENEIGMFTAMTAEIVADDYDTYGGQWLMDAIKIAGAANKRQWRYVQGILKRWQRDGRSDTQANGNEQAVELEIPEATAWIRQ